MAHEQVLEGTIEGAEGDLANKQALGQENSIGSTYAHAILAEDAIVNSMLRGNQPLSEGEWKDRTGVDQPMSMSDPEELAEWYRTVKVNLPQTREYATAVYAATTDYIQNASDEERDLRGARPRCPKHPKHPMRLKEEEK